MADFELTRCDASSMSRASLHSPFYVDDRSHTLIQYQKQASLREARQLLFVGKHRASDAAFVVRSKNASQFTREYSPYFGASPALDVREIRQALGTPRGRKPQTGLRIF